MTFSRLRHEILVLALPKRATAVKVAFLTCSLDKLCPFSRMVVRGAMASKTKVWVRASSLSTTLAPAEISDLR